MAVSTGTGARSQRRLTARSKLRGIQAIFFVGHTSASELSRSTNTSKRRPDLCSLRGYLFCLAELQELRLPSSEETLAEAVGFSLSSFPVDDSTPVSASPPNPYPLVSTWLHDEGHHSDVCELARDVILAASASVEASGGQRESTSNHEQSMAPLWTALFTCMARNGHTKALLHSLAICERKITALFDNPYLNTEIFRLLSRVANDAATRIDQVSELISAGNGSTEAHSTPASATPSLGSTIPNTHKVLLLSHNSSVGAEQWDSPPEDAALVACRVARCWTVLGRSHTSLALDPTLLFASEEEKAKARREFLVNMQEAAMHLLCAAQAVAAQEGDAPSIPAIEAAALREVLATAAQQCAVSTFGVLRNQAEALALSSSSPLPSSFGTPERDEDKWGGIVSFLGEHVVRFLSTSLSSSPHTGELHLEVHSFKVLECLVSEFPAHVVALFLNQLCRIGDAGDNKNAAHPEVSKSLVFDDENDPIMACDREGGVVPFISEIIRCCASSPVGSPGSKGGPDTDSFFQKGNVFSVIFNWVFNW